MLAELVCTKFKQKTITFHEGLNVIKGDEIATNSIGKSTALLLIDFAFGGNTFSSASKEIVDEIGHHEYGFCFKFGSERLYASRSTSEPVLVNICNEQYVTQDTISLASYHQLLKKNYGLSNMLNSFRDIVSVYARIWGKENADNVDEPLAISDKEALADGIDRLIKTFNSYGSILDAAAKEANIESKSRTFRLAKKHSFIPEINKTKYAQNEQEIQRIFENISEIRQSLAAYSTSIKEVVNDEVLKLKKEKDSFAEYKLHLDNQLAIIRENIEQNDYVTSKKFSVLTEFFPNVNVERLVEIESFHQGIKKILHNELKKQAKELEEEIQAVDGNLKDKNIRITKILDEKIDNPTVIVDRIVQLRDQYAKLKDENEFFDQGANIKAALAESRIELNSARNSVSSVVSQKINDYLLGLSKIVLGNEDDHPTLSIQDESYSYGTKKDSGTGTAYANLIMFDLAVLGLSQLPFIIHDSILYKNIEIEKIKHLVKLYPDKKQSFITIDEIAKYGEGVASYLNSKMVLELSLISPLYGYKWKKN